MLRLAIAALTASTGCTALFGLDAPVRAIVADAYTADEVLPSDVPIELSDAAPDTLVAPAGFVRLIDIEESQVSAGPHVDFPLLVTATTTWLRDTANGGDVARSDGLDIYFSSDKAGTTRLAHEVELYAATSGALVAWVKIPSLTGSQVIYLHYGDPAITTSQQNVAAVWSTGFEQILHMAGTSDSTGKTAVLTSGNVVSATGKIGGAYTFNGTDNAINTGSVSAIDNLFIGGGTIEAWIGPTGFGENNFGRILEKGNGGGWSWYVDNTNQPSTVTFLHGGDGTDGIWVAPANSISLNTWHHVAVVYDQDSAANDPLIYVNGASVAPTQFVVLQGNATSDADASVFVGNSDVLDRTYAGAIDEVRLSSISRSAGWFTTEYRNQSNPATFYTISAPL